MAVAARTVDNGTGTDYDVLVDNLTIDAVVGDVQMVSGIESHDDPVAGRPILLGGTADTDADITDVADGDVARVLTDLNGILWAKPIRRIVHCNVDIGSGFNTAAYVAGDQVGAIQTASAAAARVSGGGGIIRGVTILDDADLIGFMDVVFLSASITLATDSSAFAVTDADAEKIVGIVSVGVGDVGNNRFGNAAPFIPYWCDATSLFFTMIARSAFTNSLTNIRVQINLELD